MKIGFLFAGQGSQVVGMGKDVYDNYKEAKDIFDLNPEIRDVCFNGPEEKLNQTKYSQPAVLITSLAIAEVLKSKNIVPSFVAGLSLGEYSALTFSESFSVLDAIEIVSKRGEIMQNALPNGTSGMYAVIGLEEDVIKDAIKDIPGVCEIANYNCPGQIVITGDNEAIEEASKRLLERNARRVIRLNVSGAFHSSLLNNASEELYQVLSKYNIDKPKYEVVFNTYGKTSTLDIKETLKKQIKSSVMFEQSIRYMIEQGVDTFIEIGPGTALSGFVRKINRDMKVYSASNIEGISKIIGELI